MPRMTAYSGKREVGEIFKEAFDYEVITWKIPNISSLVVAVDREVQSPLFTFKGATWILRLYPCGHTKFGSMGRIALEIKRMHSELPVHEFFCKCYLKNPFDSDHKLIDYDSFVFDSNYGETCNFSLGKWYLTFYHNNGYRYNDTIILVCEIRTKKVALTESNFKTNSPETSLSCKKDTCEASLNPIGEIFQESFEMEVIAWKIPNVRSIPPEVDNCVQSPEFSFESASWILRMFPWGQKKFESEGVVDVIIERLHSGTPKHSYLYEIDFKAYDEEEPLFGNFFGNSNFLCNFGFAVCDFDSNHTQENVINLISYTKCLQLALSSKPWDTAVLECVLLRKKNDQIRLMSQMESVLPAADPICTITNDSGKREVGEVLKKTIEGAVITWKIPNISSLVVAANSEMQSPRFFFKGATWILKLYPCGHTKFGKGEKIVVQIERMYSEFPVHNIYFRFSFKDSIRNRNIYFRSYFSVFDLKYEQRHETFGKKWCEIFYYGHNCICNDEITLVCEIQTEKVCIDELDIESKLCCKRDMRKASLNPIGEIFKESFEMEVIAWKIPYMLSIPCEIDNSVQSPEFSFAGASWLLKMFPLGQTHFESNGLVDVVLERLHSGTPKHSILYEMCFKTYDEEKPLFESYYESRFINKTAVRSRICGSFIFDSNHTQENVINVIPYTGCLNLALSNKKWDSVVLECMLLKAKNAEITLKPQIELIQSAAVQNAIENAEKTVFPVKQALAEENVIDISNESSGSEANDDQEESEDDSTLFEERVSFEISDGNDGKYESAGMGLLRIAYDDDVYDYHVYMNSDNGKLLCEHIIAIQSALTTEKKKASWSAIDLSLHPPRRRSFRATFNSTDALKEFSAMFEEGKEAAVHSEIVEKADYINSYAENATENVEKTKSPEKKGLAQENTTDTSNECSPQESSGSEANDDQEESEDDSTLFEKRVSFEISDGNDGEYEAAGMGLLRIAYDDNVYGYHVYMTSDNGKLLCEHIIAIQTSLTTEKEKASWSAIDISLDPPRRRSFRAIFSSTDALKEFSSMFEEGKEAAIHSEIIEKIDLFNSSVQNATQNVEKTKSPVKEAPAPKNVSGTSNECSQHETSDSDSDDQEESEDDSTLFKKRVSLEISDGNGGEFEPAGMGLLRIAYDDNVNSYHAHMTSDNGKILCEHIIAAQSALRTEEKKASWSAVDLNLNPPRRRSFRATFISFKALKKFSSMFEEGKEAAVDSEIVEKADCFNSSAGNWWKGNVACIGASTQTEEEMGNWWKGNVACIEASTQTEEEMGNDCESESSKFLNRNKIIEDLKKLFLKQEDCDVIIRVQEKEFPAHTTILQARSPVLAATFRNDMKEKSTGIVDIEDCDPDTFSDLLCFLYYGEFKNLSIENVFKLYSVADKYDIPDLRTICVEFMKEKLSIGTFCKTISLALLHREVELVQLCTDFFAKNLQTIIVTTEWQSFVAQNPTESNELFIKALVPNKT